mmetsp:Transcript_39934/g.93887  ORF Transcript_39934/g.93887 Transcript_39934/m.93887 type:complete len:217 (+) Transcript_39934:822-1472(+)
MRRGADVAGGVKQARTLLHHVGQGRHFCAAGDRSVQIQPIAALPALNSLLRAPLVGLEQAKVQPAVVRDRAAGLVGLIPLCPLLSEHDVHAAIEHRGASDGVLPVPHHRRLDSGTQCPRHGCLVRVYPCDRAAHVLRIPRGADNADSADRGGRHSHVPHHICRPPLRLHFRHGVSVPVPSASRSSLFLRVRQPARFQLPECDADACVRVRCQRGLH